MVLTITVAHTATAVLTQEEENWNSVGNSIEDHVHILIAVLITNALIVIRVTMDSITARLRKVPTMSAIH